MHYAPDREPSWSEQLVSRFSLTPGQIADCGQVGGTAAA